MVLLQERAKDRKEVLLTFGRRTPTHLQQQLRRQAIRGHRICTLLPATFEKKGEFNTIYAVEDEEIFHMSFLRGYPDADLNCIKDPGVGASRLSTADINKHTTSRKFEWKRRMEFATSFTAASMRALAKLAENVSSQMGQVLPDDDSTSLLRVLAVMRQVFVDNPGAGDFLSACHYLDASYAMDRDHQQVEKQFNVFFKYVAVEPKFVPCMQLLLKHGTTLFVGASWGLQTANVASDLPTRRTGFPSNADVHKLTVHGRSTDLVAKS